MLDPNIFFNFRLYIVPGGTIENINKKNIGYLKSGLSVRTIKFYFVYYYYTGPKFFPTNDPRHNWIPISSFNAYSKHYGTNRIQYPIRLSYALTIHKSQGQTIEKAVIDLGKKEMSLGLTFVALSRLKNYKDFLIKPFTLERLNKISQSISLQPRIEEEKRISLIVNKTLSDYAFLNL